MKSKRIAVLAVAAALTVALAPAPVVFLTPALVVCLAFGLREGAPAVIIFGVISLGYSFLGSTFVSLAFVNNPWIPLIARLPVAPAAVGAYALVKKIAKKDGFLALSMGAAAGSLTNTVCVGLLLLLSAHLGIEGAAAFFVYLPTVLIMGAAELVFSAAAVPFIVKAVRKAPGVKYTPLFKPKAPKQEAVGGAENGSGGNESDGALREAGAEEK